MESGKGRGAESRDINIQVHKNNVRVKCRTRRRGSVNAPRGGSEGSSSSGSSEESEAECASAQDVKRAAKKLCTQERERRKRQGKRERFLAELERRQTLERL